MMGKFEGAKPLQKPLFPLMIGIYIHIMERGIKGVRLISNLYQLHKTITDKLNSK